jgi:uncharacterized protein
MATVWVRAYEELNDFLPPSKKKRSFACELAEGSSVTQLLAELKIPESDVDLILADGESVGFLHGIRDGERVSLFPVFETLDIGEVTELRERPLRRTRFLAPESLGQLGAGLELLGFDVQSYAEPDPETLRRAEAERRILLIRRGSQPGEAGMSRVLLVTERDPRRQLREVLSRLQLDGCPGRGPRLK